jgi:predicted AAA+ superfamily ATPase
MEIDILNVMRVYKRILSLKTLLEKKSHFLFGARSTGKSTLIKTEFGKAAKVYDLLDDEVFQRLLRDPKIISEDLDYKVIVIDEIQRLPKLLNEVHRILTKEKVKFLLTGSSARKLKSDSINLLGGRAWQAELHPLTSLEITDFNLIRYINFGGLPHVYTSKYPEDELKAYVILYLKYEIMGEALTRNIEYFLNFLDVIALKNGEELYYQGLSSDSGVPARTIQNYVEILEDTLLGFVLKPFTKTKKRKSITRSKFYLFDIGVANYLAKRKNIEPKSELFGKCFEHFIIREVKSLLSYKGSDLDLCYWRSTSQMEVDLVIGNEFAVEIKASYNVNESALKGLRALKEEGLIKRYIVVSNDKMERKIEGFELMHWTSFIKLINSI